MSPISMCATERMTATSTRSLLMSSVVVSISGKGWVCTHDVVGVAFKLRSFQLRRNVASTVITEILSHKLELHMSLTCSLRESIAVQWLGCMSLLSQSRGGLCVEPASSSVLLANASTSTTSATEQTAAGMAQTRKIAVSASPGLCA